MRVLHLKEYRDYLITLQKSIHKILPLYENNNAFLVEYVTDVRDEVKHVLDIIDVMPNGAWYPSTRAGLSTLIEETSKPDNHRKVKKKVMHLTGLLQKQIEKIEV